MNVLPLSKSGLSKPVVVSFSHRQGSPQIRPILFGNHTDHEPLIRRALFHLGEEPWLDSYTLRSGKPEKESSVSNDEAELPLKKSEPGLNALKNASGQVQKIPPHPISMETFLNSKLGQVLIDLKRVIREREKPSLIVAGGTIDTEPDPDTGTRIPNHNRQRQRMQAVMAKTYNQRTPFYPHVPDSSNIVPALQQKLMESIYAEVEQNLKLINAHAPDRFQGIKSKTRQKSISVNDIPKFFNTPRKWGRGVYVTHGSDTLAIDAALAAYLFRDTHLVSVWTGAWNSRNEPGFDGALNEKRSRQLAGHPYTPPGTYVVIGDQIHLAAKALKINNHPFQSKEISPPLALPYTPGPGQIHSYFASLDDQPVGYFDETNQPHFYTHFLREQEKRAKETVKSSPIALIEHFHQRGALRPAYVEHIVMSPETPAAVFDDLCKRLEKKGPYTGAIIEGHLPERKDWPELWDKIQALRKQNIYLFPSGKNLTPYQAQLKLSALLSEKSSAIEKNMKQDLLGEHVPVAVVKREQHHFPQGFFKEREWIQGSPALEPEVIKDATRRLLNRNVEKPVMVINGTGDGHIPIGALPLEQRLELGYRKIGEPENFHRLEQAMKQLKLDYSLTNIEKALVKVYSRDGHQPSDPRIKQMAADELRRALRHSDPMLEAIGDALDKGIQVQMGTQVTFAKPNLSTYEIGSILKFIGVTEFPEKFTTYAVSSKL